MPQITDSLKTFTENLHNNVPIICNPTGTWEVEGCLSRLVRKICHRDDARLNGIVRAFKNTLDSFESKPLLFTRDNKVVKEQTDFIDSYFKAAQAVQDIFKNAPTLSPFKCLNSLARRIAALQYRLEAANGGLDPVHIDPALKQQLISAVLKWKGDQEFMHDKTLSEKDLAKIDETCRYPQFVHLLLQGSTLKDTFFNWSLRDNNRPSLFIQFPATCSRLNAANLAIRTGRFGQDTLQIKKIPHSTPEGVSEKVLTMPFFNGKTVEHISILDGSREVTLNEGWRLSINKVFDLFTEKSTRPSDLDFFGNKGVVNWHSRVLGTWNPSTQSYNLVDLSNPDWIKNLMPAEILSKDDLEKRYDVKLMKGDCLAVARANREKITPVLEGRHTFLEVILPNDDGSYSMYPFSKYATDFPITVLEQLTFLLATVRAKIAYPDENIFYSDRQHAAYPIKLDADGKQQLLNTLQRDMIKARDGNLIFQFRRENCAFWVQSTLDSVDTIKTPRLFKSFMVECQANNPVLNVFFKGIRLLPTTWQPKIFNATDWLLGGSRGVTIIENDQKVFRSFLQTPDHEKPLVFQPGSLHKHIEDGTVKGVLFACH